MILFSIGIIVLTIFSYAKHRNIFHPVFLFLGYWGILSFVALAFGLVNEDYSISVLTSSIIFLSCFSFLFAFYFSRPRIKVWHHSDLFYAFKKIFSYLIVIIGVAIVTVTSINALRQLLHGMSFGDLRYLNHNLVADGFLSVLYKFIALPIAAMLPIKFVSRLIATKKIDIILLLLAVYMAIGTYLSDGGRTIIFIWFIALLYLLVFMFKHQKRFGKKTIKSLKIILFVLFVGIFVFFVIRTSNILSTLFIYFGSSILFFEKNIGSYDLFSHNLIVASYQGLLRPIYGLLENAFGYESTLFNSATDFLMFNQHTVQTVYFGSTYNYFTTLFAYFYVDAGIIGVILHSMIYGFLCKLSYVYLKKKKNPKSVGTYIFVIISILLSTMNYFFVEVTLAWGLVFFLLTDDTLWKFKRRKKKIRKVNSGLVLN